MPISKYLEFINESRIDLLLEANIQYTKKFKNFLSKVKSPVATSLLDLQGNEVDVNTNYIDLSTDKGDMIKFVPDDKVKPNTKKRGIITDKHLAYFSYKELFSVAGISDEGITSNDLGYIENGESVDIYKTLTSDDLSELAHKIIHWVKKDDVNMFIDSRGIDLIPDITPSDLKVGKFARKILDKAGKKFSDKDIEDFVTLYKAEFIKMRNINELFDVVSGEDIALWYHEKSYYSNSGTLGNSCMRYQKCQEYLGIYTSNKDQVSLVILFNDEQRDKIIGRALLWTDSKNRKFMDRIYQADETVIELFISYAKKNNWIYKERQDSCAGTTLLLDGSEVEDGTITVYLENGGNFAYYPYVDTVKYYLEYPGTLSNDSNSMHDYCLESTDGNNNSCESCGGSGTSECYNCDGRGESDCDECRSGSISCDSCSGEGTFECSNCEGYCETDCSTCDGSGKGDEDEDCEDCEGSGKKSCDSCSGDGTQKCEDCNGDGENDCTHCDGQGTNDCYNCDGSGTADCGECN